MATVEFFKQQAKNLLKDYNTKTFDEDEGIYVYAPRFFHDIDNIIMSFDIDEEESFTLMKAQHVIARLAGFSKWAELIKATEPILEIGRLLLTNREAYQQRQGLFTNMVESLIVNDWKNYEELNLKDADDEIKLEVFRKVFLEQDLFRSNKTPIVTIDFTNDPNAQDMLSKIMKDKNLTSEKAILTSINQKNCIAILSTGWAGIALSLWGHDDPYAEREKIDNPKIGIKLSKDKARLLEIVMEKEKIALSIAVQYFMIFTLESLGYHI